MNSEAVTYEADGLQMVGQLYYEPQFEGRRPAVLVFPEATGLDEHTKSRAERLAGHGYVALACDPHGDGRLIPDLHEAIGMIRKLREEPFRIRARANAALAQLQSRPDVNPTKIAAMGFCFGGTMALELARSGAKVVGVVGFHSGLATVTPEDNKNIKGKVLVCIGADDPMVHLEQRTDFQRQMTEAQVDWQMNVYGGVTHSFTVSTAAEMGDPVRFRYDARADARSWSEMRAFFNEIFEAS